MTHQEKSTQILKNQAALKLLTGLTGCGEACWRYHLTPFALER